LLRVFNALHRYSQKCTRLPIQATVPNPFAPPAPRATPGKAALVHRRMAMLYELIPSNHTVEKCVPRHDVLMPKRLPWMPRFAKHRVLRRKVEARRSKVKNKKSLKNARTCFTCHFFASS
jgi:hypothetical protein